MNFKLIIKVFKLCCLYWMGAGTMAAYGQSGTVTLEHGDLKAVFVDNSSYNEHRNGYNGVAELYHHEQDSNVFIPRYAGLNLEHIFDGDSLHNLFEPRKASMTIEQISDHVVQLYQPTTPLSKVESWTTFTMKEPHFIDMEFKFIVHDDRFFNHDYIGIFWASYINSPKDKGIYFKGKETTQDKVKWIAAYSPEHGVAATHLAEEDKEVYYMAPNFNVTLASGFSEYVISEPFYYGRFHNMVLAYFFSTPEEGRLRVTQSPSGGGNNRPAWDFHYLLPNFEVGKEYKFSVRMMYKEWKSARQVEKAYKKWKKNRDN